MLKTKRFQIL